MIYCFRFSGGGNGILLYVFFVFALGGFLIICVELTIVVHMHRQEYKDEQKVKTWSNNYEETDILVLSNQEQSKSTVRSLAERKKRLNVIILTHMGSGSSFSGNIFNLHPDVFYLYEPLHDLRRVVYEDEWQPLDEVANKAYTVHFESLLRDLFTCTFREETTLPRIFPPFLRDQKRLAFMYWRLLRPELTNEVVREACTAKKLTVTKIMQTRLPRQIGIQELERFCSSDLNQFDCLIIHLVRDPRAVLSSLLRRKFFIKDSRRELFDSKDLTAEATEIIKQNSHLLCSQVVDNLNYVKEVWPSWFQGRYKLVRYEDIVTNAFNMMEDMYSFVGIPKVDYITNWIVKGDSLVNTTTGTQFSENDASRIDHWRFDQDPWLISVFEEACEPLMNLMGYIPVYDSLQINNSKPLIAKEIPLLKELSIN